jgi:hypothetical protein
MIRNLVAKNIVFRNLVQPRNVTTASQTKEKWDLFAGVLVERMPIITKELNSMEKEYLVRCQSGHAIQNNLLLFNSYFRLSLNKWNLSKV